MLLSLIKSKLLSGGGLIDCSWLLSILSVVIIIIHGFLFLFIHYSVARATHSRTLLAH